MNENYVDIELGGWNIPEAITVEAEPVETDDSFAHRMGERFNIDDIGRIKILEKGTEKLGELDGVGYYIASPVTFALYGKVYFTLGNSLVYMPGLEEVYLGGDGR